MRNNYTKQNLRPVYEKNIEEIKKEWMASSFFDKWDFGSIEKLIREKIVERKGVEDEIFLTGFTEEKNDGIIREIKDALLKMRWHFMLADESASFITSDNPGYCANDKDRIVNTGFGGKFMFCFPLTPKVSLMICNIIPDLGSKAGKILNFIPVGQDDVMKINIGTRVVCNREIYANKKEILTK